MKAVIVNGGNSVASRLTGAEQQIEQQLLKYVDTVEKIIVHQLPAEDLITANYMSEAIKVENKKIEEADVVVFLTPVYKGAYSGILKTYLDLIPQKGLKNKVVIPVALGGSIAHLLSIDYALSPVLSILGSTAILHPIFIVDKEIVRNEDDTYTVAEEVVGRIEDVVSELKELTPITA